MMKLNKSIMRKCLVLVPAMLLGLIDVVPAFGFEVTGVKNWAEPGIYRGVCPATITFFGQIRANGPGQVRYQWIRSDRARTPVKRITFRWAGTQTVRTNWTLTPQPGKIPWQAIKILSPRPDSSVLRYGKAVPKIICKTSRHVRGRRTSTSAGKNRDFYDRPVKRGLGRPDGYEKERMHSDRRPARGVATGGNRRAREPANSGGTGARLQVRCPVDSVTAAVTNRLPGDWSIFQSINEAETWRRED